MVNFLHVSFYKKNFIIACKRKLLLVKHFHIKQKKIKNRCNKKESYHPLCMGNEQNGFTSVHDNGTMNLHVPVLCTGLRPSHKTLRHYILNIFCLYSPKKYGGLKSFQTTTSFQSRSSLSLTYFLAFLAPYQKSCNLYIKNELSVNKWKIKF
jgi:hypothetical protein